MKPGLLNRIVAIDHGAREQRERVALEVLDHILSNAPDVNLILNGLLSDAGIGTIDVVEIGAQVSIEGAGRPDLAGFDVRRRERLLIEAKIGAQLTVEQPNGYLARLPEDCPSALIFIVPSYLFVRLWKQVRNRAKERFSLSPDVETELSRCTTLAGSERKLMMTTWSALAASMTVGYAGDAAALYCIAELYAVGEPFVDKHHLNPGRKPPCANFSTGS